MNDYIKFINNQKLSDDLNKFIAGLPKSKQQSNIYDIICYDENGKITDHKYGVNVMTTYGFLRMYTSPNETSSYVLFGNGTGTPSKSDQQLFNALPSMLTAPVLSQNKYFVEDASDRDYPRVFARTNYFDSETNSLVCRKTSSEILLDYNYSWLPEDTDITEFGEYTETKYVNPNTLPADDYHLQTHCLVYDDQHQPSHFTKRINEKVIITVYRTNTFCFDILDTLYAQGKYMFIYPSVFFRTAHRNEAASGAGWSHYYYSSYLMDSYSIVNGRCIAEDTFPMYPAPTNVWGEDTTNWGNQYCDLGQSYNRGFGHNDFRGKYVFQDSIDTPGWFTSAWVYPISHPDGYRNDVRMDSKIMTDKTHIFGLGICSKNRIYGKSQSYEFFIEKHNLETPEEMTGIVYTDDWWHPRISIYFNAKQWFHSEYSCQLFKSALQVNDFHITSLKRYNYLTDSYSTVEQFVDDPTYDFRNPERSIWGNIYINNQDRVIPGTYSVGVNINPDIAVLGFNDKSSYDIYLTDKYWDHSTFVKLDRNDTVPAALQHKKYFIKYPCDWDNNADGGFHTIREPNKHALIPESPVTLMNTPAVPCANPAYYWWHHYYASDEGWIYCFNTLIYPDSDDGTGHPYRYTIDTYLHTNSNNWAYKLCEFTKNHIIATPYGHLSVNQTDSSTVIIKVYNLDPTHPEIDPNTTCTNYYATDIHFNENINGYLTDYFSFYVEEKKDILLLCHGNKVRKIDLNAAQKNADFIPEAVTWRMNYVFGTDYFVSYTGISENAYQYMIYDYINNQVVSRFSIPIQGTGWTLYHCCGWGDYIYINIHHDSHYYLFIYNMIDKSLITLMDHYWNYLIEDSIRGMNHKANEYDYDDETLMIHCLRNTNNWDGNTGYRTLAVFKDKPTEPTYFDNASPYFVQGYQHGYPRLKKFNNGTDYVVLLTCTMQAGNPANSRSHEGQAFTHIFDIGYIKNRGYTTPQQLYDNIPNDSYHNATVPYSWGAQANSSWSSQYYVDSNNKWYGYVVFYKNSVITFNTFGPPIITSIDMHLPHQITGTTRTINCYNSPKKFNAYNRGVVIDEVTE